MSLDLTLQKKIDLLFENYTKPNSPGCVLGIIRDGHLIFKKGYGAANLEYNIPITSKSIFCIGSCAKQFTGLCISLLEENKK
ncbi:MAG: serine hydrolase, partial [Candidatus Hodarchaeota archaeon]